MKKPISLCALLLLPCCVLHHAPGRYIQMDADISDSMLSLANIRDAIDSQITKDLYRVYGVQLVEFDKTTMSGNDLWSAMFKGDSLYGGIEDLPDLTQSICYGNTFPGLELIEPPRQIILKPLFVYQLLVHVVGTDQNGTNIQTLTVKSSFEVQEIREIVPVPKCLPD